MDLATKRALSAFNETRKAQGLSLPGEPPPKRTLSPDATATERWVHAVLERLDEIDMSQRELARRAGIPRATLQATLSGDRDRVYLHEVEAVAKVIGIGLTVSSDRCLVDSRE